MKLQYYIMEDVAIHKSGGNDVYKVVPKEKEISKIKLKKLQFITSIQTLGFQGAS